MGWQEVKAELEKRRNETPEERSKRETEWWNNFKREFKTTQDIPNIPVYEKDFMETVVCPKLIECGAIPKDKLIVGHTYLGKCRNASKAVWKENGKFEYMRTEFGFTYPEEINHFQDDDGYDLFIPIKDITEDEHKSNSLD